MYHTFVNQRVYLQRGATMLKWFNKKSLVVSSSIFLSLLLTVLIGIVNFISYETQKQSFYHEFEQIGGKLRDQLQVNIGLIQKVAAAIEKEQELPQFEMELLRQLLNAITDDELVTNAYFLTTEHTKKDDENHLRMLQISESLVTLGMSPGDDYKTSDFYIDVFENAKKGQSGLTSIYKDEYGKWMTYLAPLKDTDGEVAVIFAIGYDYGKVESRLNVIMWKSIGISALISALAILLVVGLVRLAVGPLRILAATAKEAAQGDLTVTVPVKSDNEIGQAGKAFNEMIISLRDLTSHIEHTSREVSESSTSLKETAGQTEAATNEIAGAIQNVATSAETQLVSAQECQRAMMEMTIGIQKIAESSSVVSDLAADTTSLAVEGEEVMMRTVQQMNTIEEHVFSASDAMRELNHSSNRIGDILSHISDVANQTNLLALNASIEAARAGEHGKGFAVVAHEIRKLAERSKQSSDEIAGILHEIGSRSHEVTDSLTISANETRSGTELANASSESFRAILRSVREVSGQVQEVSAASEQMSAGSEEIAASLVELERMAHNSASHSQEVAAASEEQLASVEEVASSSEQLRSLANELRAAVGKFKV